MKPFGSTKKEKSKSVIIEDDLTSGKVSKGTTEMRYLTEHLDKVPQ